MIIRKATKEDTKNIINYFNKVGGESDNLLFGKDEFKNMPIDIYEKIIENINNSKNDIMLLAVIDGNIVSVGFLQGLKKERLSHRASLAISVSKKYWGQGIGKAMINYLIDFARQANIKVIELQVRCDNERGIRLYENLGFEKIGTYKKYFCINNLYYDAFLMNLYL